MKKKYLHLYLKFDSESQFDRDSDSTCANQATDFSVSGSSTLNRLFQTLNPLKRLMGYSKRLHQLHPPTVPFEN